MLIFQVVVVKHDHQVRKMNKLKFSHDFEKLPVYWEGTQAILVGVLHIPDMEIFKKRLPQLIKADTLFKEDGLWQWYSLNFKEGILLTFFHLNISCLFTTFRQFTDEKYRYYEENAGETFELVRE